MKKLFAAAAFAICAMGTTGCGGSSDPVVIDQTDADKYAIPPGEMEKAMKEAAAAAGKKSN